MVRRLVIELSENGYDDTYIALTTFGVDVGHPANTHTSASEYASTALLTASDGAVRGLHDYYFGAASPDGLPEPAPITHDPWTQHRFRLFVSHVYNDRQRAMTLKASLDTYGIDAFVAHNDIAPSAEWLAVIEYALGACDAFLALLTDGFRESPWCDQEVGYAFAHGKLPIPARFDKREPHGLLGRKHALNLIDSGFSAPRANARTVVQVLLNSQPSTAARLVDAMVHRVVESTSWNMTNEVLPWIAKAPGHVTEAHVSLLEGAMKSNIEVEQAFEAGPIIEMLRSIVDAR